MSEGSWQAEYEGRRRHGTTLRRVLAGEGHGHVS
jgi:hypothetical protein